MTLELEGLTKVYKDKTALDDVSFSFTPGIYGLLGPNGAGKSTMMNLISDNLTPSKGRVLLDGRGIDELGSEYRKLLGYMPQQQNIYPELSLRRFLYFMASLKGLKKSEAGEDIDHYVRMVKLDDVLGKKLGAFSGGMKQRALIAQALIGNPGILILDEPTAGLDPKERIDADQRRLARAVRPEQPVNRPPRNFQRHVVERRMSGVTLGDLFYP